ncbi:MAG TPA: hypothetical protein VK986_14470, partial [Tepidisphaeraceae bacterium]|nr:hypothetical protein [Tepidisphaeraceae bacterium]
ALVPDTIDGKIMFFHVRTGPWAAHAAQIGAAPEVVAELAARVADARAKRVAATTARAAAEAATAQLNMAVDALAALGSDVVKQIRAKAAVDGDGVYALAMLPRPARPSRVPPPGKPESFAVELRQDGSLRLAWTCRNPAGSQGTVYTIARQIGPADVFVTLGTVGVKSFVDDTLPAGAARVTYQVQAIRSTRAGEIARFGVKFGGAGGAAGGAVFQKAA